MKGFEEIKMTKLDECYLIMYMIKSQVNMKNEKCIETKNVYTIIIYLVVDDNTYLKKYAKVSYLNVEIIRLLLEIADEFYKYFSDKFSSKIRTEIKQLYLPELEEQYHNSYSLFIEKYGHNSILVFLITSI